MNALLVGSRPSWRTKLDPVLTDYGITVRWWWESKSDISSMPQGCDVVLVATDCNSHAVSEPAMRRARDASIPVHTIVHRKAALVSMLERAGFALSPKETLMQPTPVPPQPYSTGARFETLLLAEKALYSDILPLLAGHPWATAPAVASSMSIALNAAQRTIAVARVTLGIVAPMGSGPAKIGDRPRYEWWCQRLGVSPVTEDIGPNRLRRNEAHELPKPIAAPVPNTPPVLVRTPPPSPSPSPTNTALSDVRAAIALLREAMAREGVEEILLTPTTATVTRRITITESL